jgi:hypothetical protein
MEVRTTLSVSEDTRKGWSIFIPMGDMFDEQIPFREGLDEIVEALSGIAPAVLSLPPHAPEENFVEGILHWQGHPLGVYFETFDAYLLLHSADRRKLDEALPLIAGISSLRP